MTYKTNKNKNTSLNQHLESEAHEEFLEDFAGNIEKICHDNYTDNHQNKWSIVVDNFKKLHVADQADIYQQVSKESRVHLINFVYHFKPEFLTHLAEELIEELFSELDHSQLSTLFNLLDSSEIVEIFSSIESIQERSRLLSSLSLSKRRLIGKNLAYPESSVGRIMRQHFVAMPITWTVGQAINVFRKVKSKSTYHDFYSVMLVDERNRPVGIVNISLILKNQRNVLLSKLCQEGPVSITALTDKEDVIMLFRRYGLIEAPVIDESGELVGSISVQEIFDIIEDVHEDDLLNLSGVKTDDFYQDVYSTAKARIVWLLVNLATAILASGVISLFSDDLSKVVTLAVLMPIVASMGGNAGTQALAIAVRALATNQITSTNTKRILIKELIVGIGNGALLGLVTALLTRFWFGPGLLPWIIAMAMVINIMTAGILGFGIPVLLEKLEWDPAVGSSIILTTFTDCVGFFAFLGLASLVL